MHRAQTTLLAALLVLPSAAADFSGARALEFTRQAVAFGPRAAGSPASKKLQAWLLAQLKDCGCEVVRDLFTAQTPHGPVPMLNIVARFRGTPGAQALAVTGHYDTKFFRFPFVGANDAGSSTGFLLELARALKGRPTKHDIYLVWFDGEEAFKEWTETDSLYGSRHLAEKWYRDGTIARLKALINVDMIGDRDLVIEDEQLSSAVLRALIWQVARDLGYARHFGSRSYPVEDDHAPFLRRGVRAADLIDFDYGPGHSWWHTAADTMDKLSPASFEVVGRVVLETLRRLDNR
jgi:Zn-dependent M28 family amino/carboxypeptidase